MAKDYIPQTDGELAVWLENFKVKLAEHGAALGLTAAQVTALASKCTTLQQKINLVEQRKTDYSQAVEEKRAAKQVDIPSIRQSVIRMKTEAGYTNPIGEDIGIVGPAFEAFATITLKPVIKAKVFPGYVEITFTKGQADGVNVYARLRGQTAWQKLAFDSSSPYTDNRPLAVPGTPEAREYSAIAVVDDNETGERSDVVEAVFGG